MYEIFLRLLAERGVTTADVCKATGISQSTLSNWKKRNNILSPALLGKIADYFNVSMDYMIGKDIVIEMNPPQSRTLSGNVGMEKSALIQKLADILMEEHESGLTMFPEVSDEAKQFALDYDKAPDYVKQAIQTLLKAQKPGL